MMKYILLFAIFFSGITFGQIVPPFLEVEKSWKNKVPNYKEFLKDKLNMKNVYYENVDQIPVFNYGNGSFNDELYKIFDKTAILSKGYFTSKIYFIVDEKGYVKEYYYENTDEFTNEYIRSVKEVNKTKWKPAMVKGKPVKYLVNFIIAMKIN